MLGRHCGADTQKPFDPVVTPRTSQLLKGVDQLFGDDQVIVGESDKCLNGVVMQVLLFFWHGVPPFAGRIVPMGTREMTPPKGRQRDHASLRSASIHLPVSSIR